MIPTGLTPEAIIGLLGMRPHPEGGHFVETYRHMPEGGGRGASTCIYFLLREGERSHWHRVLDADEVWHWYAGSSLTLGLAPYGGSATEHVLGPDLLAGERPQLVVPAGWWQAATSRGGWTLVGCTVAPAFEFAKFELAPPGWSPGRDKSFSP
ncbi:MAG TPA: cupin domain-containing protein [Azospirillaceae bacterium]|nr:cupin domain-containing protein [Azospirillaceae bacterium]